MQLKAITTLLAAIFAIATPCLARDVASVKVYPCHTSASDSIMHKAIGDSICNIICKAKHIEITSLASPSDTLSHDFSRRVPASEMRLVKFIVMNPKNYTTNVTKFGVFMPQIQLRFKAKRAEIMLKYDFGLRKWGVFDASGKEIAIFDLWSDNMLRYACNVFPHNQFLNEMQK